MAGHNRESEEVLTAALPGRVSLDEETRYGYSFDSLKVSFLPDAVVRARKEGDVGTVLELANRHGVPVVPRGAATSRTAGATPQRGGGVLDLGALTRVSVDSELGIARAQAGVVTAVLQERAEAVGWFYPPDPSSKKYSTIGGNIACNAGGLRGAKYGVTRDYVMALRGYLPTGEPVEWGRRTRKFAAGFNMRDLWIGSEGLLGVVTSATLKLVPRPDRRWTLEVAFRDEEEALEAVSALLAMRVVPAICEFMDRNAVRGAEAFKGGPVFPGLKDVAVVLLELDGSKGEVESMQAKVKGWARARGLRSREARTGAEAEALWETRRSCSPAMYRLADSKLNEDIVVPLDRQLELMRFVQRLEKQSKLPIATFGHAADGNLHVNILYHQADAEERKRAFETAGKLMRKVVSLGGAISGEHGIGLAKTPFLKLQFSDAELNAMRKVKAALDPQWILNPGKVFEETRIWEYEPVEHRFPWDRA